ncbi:MAG: homoserine/homoserine lactone efflux protein [Pseudomonadota bacterium]|nr:homoserine/homoserine lactone efflux protein [Pseudomonadota bacterium]
MTTEIWSAFLLAALIISLSPGSGAVNTMSNGIRYGVRRTLPSILGLQLGLAAQILLVGIGLGTLIATSNTAFSIIKWLGVAYLLWLGYRKWTHPPLALETAEERGGNAGRRFWEAAFINLTNPKATVFLIALFPLFIDPRGPKLPQFAAMGATLIAVDTFVMLGYATLSSSLSMWLHSERHQHLLNRLFGSLFIVAAALMAGYNRSS